MTPFTTIMVRSSIALLVASVHILSVAAARASLKPAAHAASSFLVPVRTCSCHTSSCTNVSGSPHICDVIMRVSCWHLGVEVALLCRCLKVGNLLLTTNNHKRGYLLLGHYGTPLLTPLGAVCRMPEVPQRRKAAKPCSVRSMLWSGRTSPLFTHLRKSTWR